ncbi:MAG: hypothetical protein ACOC1G_05715 [Phycisphaeraceae bacterium]
MAWTTMHFGIGMACGGAAATLVAAFRGRGWKWITPVMTLSGIWALGPDLPRIFREGFPSLPLARYLGDESVDRWLLSFGDVFFFHAMLDSQPRQYAVQGLVLILLCYNAAWLLGRLDNRRSRPHVPLPPHKTGKK